jgi:hypothetical protein
MYDAGIDMSKRQRRKQQSARDEEKFYGAVQEQTESNF